MALTTRNVRRRISSARLFFSVACFALAIGSATIANAFRSSAVPDETADEGSEQSEAEAAQIKAAERFLTVLEKTPRRGTALDRVYGHHVEFGTLDQFLGNLREKTTTSPDDGTSWMLLGLFESQRGQDARTLRYRFAGQVHGLDLTRAYADFRAGGRSLASFIEARTHSLPSRQSEGPRSLEEAGSRLLPMIRDRRYLGLAVLMAQVTAPTAEVPALPFRELAGELVVTLALDSETTIQTLAEANLAACGVDFDTACERAIANLRRRGLLRWKSWHRGSMAREAEIHMRSRVCSCHELTSSLPLRGEAIASLPASELLLLAGSQDSAALAAQAQLTANVIAEARRPLSAQLIQRSAQGWVTADQALSRHPALVRAGHVLLQRD